MSDEMQDVIRDHVAQLAGSAKGRSTLRYLSAWLDDSGCGLDSANQFAAIGLITLAWEGLAGSVRDAMREETTLTKANQGDETMTIFTRHITRGYTDTELARLNAEWARIVEVEGLESNTDEYYTRQDQFVDEVNHFSPRDVKHIHRPLRSRDIPDDSQTYPE